LSETDYFGPTWPLMIEVALTPCALFLDEQSLLPRESLIKAVVIQSRPDESIRPAFGLFDVYPVHGRCPKDASVLPKLGLAPLETLIFGSARSLRL
jgi:hypothetical protein